MLSDYIISMAIVCSIVAIIYLIVRLIFAVVMKRKFCLKKEFPVLLFVAYCAGVFSMTIPIYTILRSGSEMINGTYHSINLVPFKTISGYISRRASIGEISLANVLGNILLFVPMGVLLPVVFKGCRRWFQVILIGAAASIVIESIQYFFGRSADIDDVILNTLGTAVGYCCYFVIHSCLKGRRKNKDTAKEEIRS